MQTPVGTLLDEKGRDVVSVGPNTTVAIAVKRMNEAHIGSLLVMDGGRLLGIITERDVLVKVVADGRNARTTLVEEVMTRDLVRISPSETVEEAMLVMTRARCRHLPVVENARLEGIISIGDVLGWLVRHQQHRIEGLLQFVADGPASVLPGGSG